MAFWDRWFRQENRSSELVNGFPILRTGGNASGVSVTPGNALNYSAVFAAVRVIAETVASLPLILYQQTENGRERAADYYLYDVLKNRPNPYLTSYEFRELLQAHLLLWGNAYCEIELDNAGRVVGLWPLRPDKVKGIKRDGARLTYAYELPMGETVDLPDFSVFHLRGLSSDGVVGYSPISLMRQTIGVGKAAEAYGAGFFGNGANPRGVLTHPGALGDTAFDNLKNTWAASYQGLSNAHKVAILEEGMSYKQISIPPNDAQFLETRRFQVEEIARIFRVPPHMLGDLERATFSNIEHQSIDFVVHSIRPWLVRWEQAIAARLMSDRERALYTPEFLVDGLLRGDTKSRYETYGIAIQNGVLSRNDVRALENLNRVEGLDDYLVPLNLAPVGSPVVEDGERSKEEKRNKSMESREARANRSGANRRRIQNSYIPVYSDALGRVLRREAQDVGGKLRILENGDTDGFLSFVNDFYEGHGDFVQRQIKPVAESYAALVLPELAEETGEDVAEERVSGWIDSYLETFAARYTAIQRSRIEKLVERSADEGVRIVEDEIDSYRDDLRAYSVATEEANRMNNGLAVFAYTVAGIVTKRWLAFGESCDYCNALNGRQVGMSLNFIDAGEAFAPGGVPALVPSYGIGHPPAHRGCDCMVVSA